MIKVLKKYSCICKKFKRAADLGRFRLVLRFSAALTHVVSGVETLRDTNLENLHEKKDEIGEDHWKKALHVIKEINRTQQVAEILTRSTNNSDLKIIGHLMAESHESLRDLYEVSCPEVDLLVDCAMKQPGVLGARITGWLATEMLEVNKRVKLFRPFSYFDESFFCKSLAYVPCNINGNFANVFFQVFSLT